MEGLKLCVAIVTNSTIVNLFDEDAMLKSVKRSGKIAYHSIFLVYLRTIYAKVNQELQKIGPMKAKTG